jgi:saccharopine dehydrogenase (NAD+, L-lysine forming)
LDKTDKVKVRGSVEVSPRDVVAACLPDPAKIGPLMKGKTCAGTLVKGRDSEGNYQEVYLYQVADNEECMKRWGCQAVVAQTAFNVCIGLDLLFHSREWTGVGVLAPEAFPPIPFMSKMEDYGFPYGERWSTPSSAGSETASTKSIEASVDSTQKIDDTPLVFAV